MVTTVPTTPNPFLGPSPNAAPAPAPAPEPEPVPGPGGDAGSVREPGTGRSRAGSAHRSPAPAPDAVAVSGPGGELTYRELSRRVGDLAAVLRERGVGPETPVGLCMERTTGMVVALLAVWAAGGAYVPLDPAFPEDRLALMREDAGIGLVLTQPGVDRRLLAGVPDVLSLTAGGEIPPVPGGTPAPGAVPAVPATPGLSAPGLPVPGLSGPAGSGLAYVLYTSGSTGRPKGVEVPGRAVANLLASFADRPGLLPEDRWLAVTTLSFDISVLELLLPLACGARVVVASAEQAADGPALRALAVAERITVMQATPATWRILLEAGGVPETVRLRLCGGEALPRDLADALLAPGADLWNVYGPTETTVWSTAGIVEPPPAGIGLGGPIAGTFLYVLDERGLPVPDGEAGELHIGGDGLARGYRGMPGPTAARFLPDPFAGRPGARMYATGDLVRNAPDGRLEYLGRADRQVKIRGFRVELGEIETVMHSVEGVRRAAAGVCDGPDGLPRLVAYVVPAPTPARLPAPEDLWETLRDRLRASLPEYMVPAHLVTLDALPLTPNGKLDRAALPAPDWTASPATPYRAPSTPAEDELATMWAEVLGVDRPIGVDDDFFELGGHSLTAARIIARVQSRFGAAVPIVVLFENPTVAGLARCLDDLDDDDLDLSEIAALRDRLDGLDADELAAIFDELAPGS
ncbi:amino acid adenylation domain-containing protein [Streptosporangium sp. NPDC050855]|uniref:amino acid adenylation domain-containing protein n=1 Tax=Streptosporangium sp. NPDC050855 TaxID=3366194 RepID=UPI0037991A13